MSINFCFFFTNYFPLIDFDIHYVINYDLPKTIDEYVHKIGRTGRIGNAGKAISFFDPDRDGALASDLVNTLKQVRMEKKIHFFKFKFKYLD